MTDKEIRKKYDGEKLWGLRLVKELLAFIVIIALILIFVIGVTRVDGESMYPTLTNGSVVLFFKLKKTYERGDIIAIRMANGDNFVKRVIAVPGDTVDFIDGKVLVNGHIEHYAKTSDETSKQSFDDFPVTLSEGQYFVLGDNRPKSIDSRTFGPISSSQTRGKVLFVR